VKEKTKLLSVLFAFSVVFSLFPVFTFAINDTVGGTNLIGQFDDLTFAVNFTPTNSGIVTSIGINLFNISSPPTSLDVALYSDNTSLGVNKPAYLLTNSSVFVAHAGWNDLNVTPVDIVANGSRYWISFQANSGQKNFVYYNNGNYQSYGTPASYFGFNSTWWNGVNENNGVFNMRVTYNLASYILNISADTPNCGNYFPPLNIYTVPSGSVFNETVYPNCPFLYWNITGNTGSTLNSSTALNLQVIGNTSIVAIYNSPNSNGQQNQSVGGGIALPSSSPLGNISWLDFFFNGYTVLFLINVALAGFVVIETRKNPNHFEMGIATFIAFALLFLFTGFYPVELWIIVFFAVALEVTIIATKIRNG
jgi:hypothetical protein